MSLPLLQVGANRDRTVTTPVTLFRDGWSGAVRNHLDGRHRAGRIRCPDEDGRHCGRPQVRDLVAAHQSVTGAPQDLDAVARRCGRPPVLIRHTDTAGDRVQQAREQLGLDLEVRSRVQVETERMIQETLASETAFRKVCDRSGTPSLSATDRRKTIADNRTLALIQAVPQSRHEHRRPRRPLGRLPSHHRIPRPRRSGTRQDRGRQGGQPRVAGNRRACPVSHRSQRMVAAMMIRRGSRRRVWRSGWRSRGTV